MIAETTKKYLTIGETRATLGASRSFVYKLIANGLPTYKIGRRSYVKADELESLFQKKS